MLQEKCSQLQAEKCQVLTETDSLKAHLSSLSAKAEEVNRVKQAQEEEIASLKTELHDGFLASQRLQDELKSELKRWSQVHQVNRKSVEEFKRKVEYKVRKLQQEKVEREKTHSKTMSLVERLCEVHGNEREARAIIERLLKIN